MGRARDGSEAMVRPEGRTRRRHGRIAAVAVLLASAVTAQAAAGTAAPAGPDSATPTAAAPTPGPTSASASDILEHAEGTLDLRGDFLVRTEDGTTTVVPEPVPWGPATARAGGALESSLEGFRSWNRIQGNRGNYVIRLVSSPGVEGLRSSATTVAGELSAISGTTVTVAGGLLPAPPNLEDDLRPGVGEIRIAVSTRTPCGTGVIGCGEVWATGGTGDRGSVWITPQGMGLSPERITSLVRHEIGHTLGLNHYQQAFQGSMQVMATQQAEALPFRAGDRNGLRFLDPTCRNRPRDVPTHNPFCDEVAWTLRNGILAGWPDGSFQPGLPVSRQAMAVLLHRYAGSPPVTGPAPFNDLQHSHPEFRDAITWLHRSGIASGYEDGTFRPTAPVSRQAMAVFLWETLVRANPSLLPGTPDRQFGDVRPGHRFRKPINALANLGVVQGTSVWEGGRWVEHFVPVAPVTRQALAAFLFRADNL